MNSPSNEIAETRQSMQQVHMSVGWRKLQKHAVGIPRSRDEMSVNWKWLKDMSLGQHKSRRTSHEPVNGRV
jgi:hypothetical protein